jgi:hypothetical protein
MVVKDAAGGRNLPSFQEKELTKVAMAELQGIYTQDIIIKGLLIMPVKAEN